MHRLVLASTSRYRREMLVRLSIPFEAAAPEYEEEKGLDLPAEELVKHFARAKARSLAHRYPDALIIGADQAPVLDGRILGKPGTEAAAVEQLTALAGRSHRLVTAVALFSPAQSRLVEELDVARLQVRALGRKEIRAYVKADQPLDCAGSYKTEGLGVVLFEEIVAQDPTALVGLPLLRLARLLRSFGFEPLSHF